MAKRIELECGHEIWFSVSPPKKGDLIFCSSCEAPAVVGAPHVGITTGTYEAEYEWVSTKETASTFKGVCCLCDYVRLEKSWAKLSKEMSHHHITKHVYSTVVGGIEYEWKQVDLPPNSPAPF